MRPRHLAQLPVVLAAALLIVTACSNTPPAPSPGAGANLGLVTPGKLTIGYFPSMPVTDVKDGKGIGTNGALMQEVADHLGLQAVWQPYAFAALIPALQSHRIDTLAAGLQHHPAEGADPPLRAALHVRHRDPDRQARHRHRFLGGSSAKRADTRDGEGVLPAR